MIECGAGGGGLDREGLREEEAAFQTNVADRGSGNSKCYIWRMESSREPRKRRPER